jgi:hypothetical protein
VPLNPRIVFALSLSMLLAGGCHKDAPPPPAAPVPVYATVDYANGGTIRGVIQAKGHFPERIAIDMGQDPACNLAGTDPNLTETFVVNDGGLANVFVYVKSGLGDQKYGAPAATVLLDQKGCRYVPHVVALMAGQQLRIQNNDMTMHNVHPLPISLGNHSVDITQAPGGKPVDISFPNPEIMIPVRCNNHPWMEAYINVAANPFYAISDSTGHYEIRGLPPGTYTLGIRQEKIVEKEITVTVAAHGTATADVQLSAP